MKKLLSLIILTLAVNAQAKDMTKVRIGWQVPWAIQGQLVQIFKHTDILKKHQIEAEFVGKTYGPELNELALGNQVDVVLTADQPAAVLFSKDKGWIGFTRLMYNRTSTYVPVKSPITKIEDLKGKTLGVPFGAAAERITSEAISKAGLTPKTDVTYVNLAMPEHMPLVKKADKEATKFAQFGFGGFGSAQVKFNLTGISGETAHELFSSNGISNMYLNLEGRYQSYQKYLDSIKISGASFGVGVSFEFL